MLVTSADYSQWQSMYGHGSSEKTAHEPSQQGQNLTVSSGESMPFPPEKTTATDILTEESQEKTTAQAFYENTMAQLLANRIGIDKEKLNELKEELEAKQKEYETLAKENPITPDKQKTLDFLANKINQLELALERFIQQSSEQAVDQAVAKDSAETKLNQYENVASFL